MADNNAYRKAIEKYLHYTARNTSLPAVYGNTYHLNTPIFGMNVIVLTFDQSGTSFD